jgi:hypothetical protein
MTLYFSAAKVKQWVGLSSYTSPILAMGNLLRLSASALVLGSLPLGVVAGFLLPLPDNGSIYLVIAAPVFVASYAFGPVAWPELLRGQALKAGLQAFGVFAVTIFTIGLVFFSDPDLPDWASVLGAAVALATYGLDAPFVGRKNKPLADEWSRLAFISTAAMGLTWIAGAVLDFVLTISTA